MSGYFIFAPLLSKQAFFIAGPICLVIFYLISLMTGRMLAQCYEWHGVEHARYHQAVYRILGRSSAVIVATVQFLLFALVLIAYTITGASSIVQIASISCTYAGKDPESIACLSPATGGLWKSSLMFGAVQLLLGQIKNLEEGWWLSTMGTVSSLIYSCLALGLSLSQVSNRLGSIGGIPVGMKVGTESGEGDTVVSPADKAFGVLSSLGSLAYAFSFALILIEVGDTLHQPPPAVISMKKAINISATSAGALFLAVGVTGYSAIGNGVTPIIFDSFTDPMWLVLTAHIAIVLQMFASFQEFFQPLLDALESHIKWRLLCEAIRKDAQERRIKKEKSAAIAVSRVDIEAASSSGNGSEDKNNNDNGLSGERQLPQSKDHYSAAVHPNEPFQLHAPGVVTVPATGVLSALVRNDTMRPVLDKCGTIARGSLNEEELLDVVSRTLTINRKGVSRLLSTAPRPSPRPDRKLIREVGFGKEGVPHNEEGFMLPLYWRILVRSAVTLLATLIAAIMPFFGAFISLIGSLTFWPLSVYFPIACYRKINVVSPRFDAFLNVLIGAMAAVCAAALVASVRSIAMGFSTYSIFGM